MSLALLGDALLYAVLPVYAADFGLTLPWVGVMLSANLFVRVFAYGAIARITVLLGLRKMCIIAAITATVSTAIYGFGQGPAVILFARILWGLTYGILVLATLSYAVTSRKSAGAWLVGRVGPNMAFMLIAILTALALPLALRLPHDATAKPKPKSSSALRRPKPIDILFFLQGYGVDGVFAITITLIFARETSVANAVMSGSALLAMRHFGEAIAAPLFGWIADKLGASKVFIGAATLTMLGFIFVAIGWTVLGAMIMLIFRGALASLGPAVIAQSTSEADDVIGPLARMQAWRDLGAACGPLATGFLLTILSPEVQHALVAIALGMGISYWLYAKRPRH
jgi:DHA1 family inner membrane transport protein